MGAAFEGVAMVPGVSLNRRLYTRELITKAVRRAQERLTAGVAPLTMLTHHAAEDDSTRIVGGLTEIWQDPDTGEARFRGRFADTPEAATISALVIPEDGSPPFLRGVSIRGWWLGEVQRVLAPDGAPADTADDLELDGVDFTKNPGVTLAGISTDESSQGGRTMVRESVTPVVGDAAPPARAATTERYADLGYLGGRRLPLTTSRQAVETWHTLATDEGTKGYTRPQAKRLRQRTREALTGHGLTVTEDGTVLQRVAEGFAWGWDQDGSMQVRLSNGPIDVAVSTWCVDPAALDAIGMAAMRAALDALAQLDPDADGDIDVGATTETTETAAEDADDEVSETSPEPAGSPAPIQEQEPAVMGDTTPAAETAAPEALTTAHIPALAEAISQGIAAALRPAATEATAGTAPAAAPAAAPVATPAAEAAAPAGFLSAADVERMLAEQQTAIVQNLVSAYGPPRRRGLVGGATVTTETAAAPAGDQLAAPAKAPHEMSAEEFAAWSGGIVNQVLPG